MSIFNSSRLVGKTVLLTGASSGIGKVSIWYHSKIQTKTRCASSYAQATAVLFAKVHITSIECSRDWTCNWKQAGSNVILLARRADALKNVEQECLAAHKSSGLQEGGNFARVQIDVSQKEQVHSLWDKVPNELRDVDILGGHLLVLLSYLFSTNTPQMKWTMPVTFSVLSA